MIRKEIASGTFYPDNIDELGKYFDHFNTIFNEQFSANDIQSRAVIVPHAGYIYSGITANAAYRILQNSNAKNFVVIGPSHKIAFNGISLCEFESYRTPLGNIDSAAVLIKKLKTKFEINCVLQAHAEHSTEVQFPFIKHYLKDVNIAEIVYGKEDPRHLSQIIDYILEDKENGVIISTDLSHFHNLRDAEKLDNICLKAIELLDIDTLHSGCEACGMIGVEAILLSAKKGNLKAHLLDYRTSAEASGDESRVVGYVSAYLS
ncbi:AmmeMemoRadiSam system protein B [Desulforhopalus vacuolatus]|uniref:AmmeMemoRadiSam system protein B n=1 Tax=Desulforhopalus vacuolatus TaxID=40414 RepID=UPI00196263C3|nr:AmmeMemoRadiSam system protein B [Desulforhopalus vacuolatus]MBM9518970.1 AmmeMemoRadiSam system protein B [Desulforhopalus vacuolatus]